MEDTSTIVSRPRAHLVDARLARHLSQLEVADLIGTTHVNVSRWERGITRPSPYFRRKLCKLFEKSEEELDLGAQGSAPPPAASPPPHSATGPAAPSVIPPPTPQPIFEALYYPVIPLPPSTELIGRGDQMAAVRQRPTGCRAWARPRWRSPWLMMRRCGNTSNTASCGPASDPSRASIDA